MTAIRSLVMFLSVAVVFTPLASSAQESAPPAASKTPPKNLLDVIPDDIWAMIYLPSMAQLDEKVAKYAQRLNLPMLFAPTMMARMMTGLSSGVDDRREFAVVLFPVSDASKVGDSTAILIPATDHASLIALLSPEDVGDGVSSIKLMDKSAFTASTGGYTIMAPTRDVLARVLKATKTLRPKFNRHQLDRLATDDVTVWANSGAITSSELFTGFTQMIEASGAVNGLGQLREFNTVGVSLRQEPTGLALGFYMDAKPATEMHAALAEMPTTTESLLNGLPRGPFVATGGQIRSKAISALAAKMFDKMLDDLDNKSANETEKTGPAGGKQMGRVLQRIRAPVKTLIADLARIAVSVSPLPEGSEGMIAVAKVIATHDDARRVCTALREIVDGVKQEFADDTEITELLSHIEYKVAAEKAGSVNVDHLVIKLPEKTKTDIGEEGMAAMKAVLGSDRLLARIAVVDDRHVAITVGGGVAYMSKVIEAVKSNAAPLSNDAGLKRVAKFVPKKRNTEAYFAVDQLIKLVSRIAKAVGEPFPVTMPEINAPVAMVTSLVPPAGTQTDIYIPIELIAAIKDAITNAIGQQMNAEPPAS